MSEAARAGPRVAVIGAGFAGIGAGIRLKALGVDDLVIFERSDGVGGTWRDNVYPGAACDIPSHLYSYSFDLNPDWTHVYSPQVEIRAYLEGCADRYGLRPHLRLGTEVLDATLDEASGTWRLRTSDGDEHVADVVISAVGILREPAHPRIEGLGRFAGAQMHTARWDPGVTVAGRRVGVIGTGASAVQVVPAIADEAERLTVFQRSAPWVVPRGDRAYSERARRAFRTVPGATRATRATTYLLHEARLLGFRPGSKAAALAERGSLAHLHRQVTDPDLRRRLTPDYPIGCKRILVSDDYWATLAREDVDLVTDPVAEVTPAGVRTGAGEHLDLDVLVHATGFKVRDMLSPLTVIGRGGVDLEDAWRPRPSAYLGMSVPDFPNLFVLYGPNTNLGHNSIIFMLEAQLHHVAGAVRRLQRPDVAMVEVRRDTMRAFEDEVDRRNDTMAWNAGCGSWYVDEGGHNFTMWPGTTLAYWWRTRRYDPRAYRAISPDELPALPGWHGGEATGGRAPPAAAMRGS